MKEAAGLILIGWVIFIVYIFFKNRKKTITSISESRPSNEPSSFLKEQIVSLEDGRFGFRIEFLKNEFDLDELVDAGRQVFEFKKFLEDTKKGHRDQKEPVSNENTLQTSDEYFVEEIDYNGDQALKEDEMEVEMEIEGPEIYKSEKYKLADLDGLINFKLL